jgi:hypothetical protein
MKKIVVYVACVMLMVACGKGEEKIPDDLIAREKLIPLLADMQYTEAIIQLKNLSYTDSTKTVAYGHYKYVLEKHKVSPEDFKNTFNWYKNHPKEMSELYKDVLTQLSKDAATKKP